MDMYDNLRGYLSDLIQKYNLADEKVEVTCHALSTQEAIGNPSRNDFPLLKGKERLLEATYKGSKGQAYTDSLSQFSANLSDFLSIYLDSSFNKAALIAVLNAVMRRLALVEGTVHCKNEEPALCAQKAVPYLKERYPNSKIAIIGLQPALLQAISQEFSVRLADLDNDNIGQVKSGVTIEDARFKTDELIEWADLLFVTGSTVANGSIVNFLDVGKPVIFYGTTIAGTAKIFGLERFCPCST